MTPFKAKQWADVLMKAAKKSQLHDVIGDEFSAIVHRYLIYDMDNKPTRVTYLAKFYNLSVGDTTFGDCYVTCGDYRFEVFGVFVFEVKFFSNIMAGDVEKIHAKAVNTKMNLDSPVHANLTMPNDLYDSFEEAEHHLMLIGLACAE